MERYICIHGHFYQPPRENPWLEAVEVQDSASPYHDWNERITAECYGPNAFARILDGEGRISQIVNNYARISFNFGPTLLSWLQEKVPDIYQRVLEADKKSQERFSGHGSALAQAYNHMILPLANRRDKYTQVHWGIQDFEHRFGRKPEGLWLPETAVDVETLEVLAELGIKFTILAPHQAGKARKIGEADWQDVTGGRIDPTMAYVQHLPSGRKIHLFFYDGPISRAIAFEKLLAKGENLVNRLLGAFSDTRTWPQLVNIATDGETYGHHHTHGDMALAYAVHDLETNQRVRLTVYGEFLEQHPPTHEVEIVPNTSWSCAHGVERWRSDCGCNSGRSGWNQAWRAPLRAAFDWLRDSVEPSFEEKARALVRGPWAARDAYIRVMLNRSRENIERFLEEHASRELNDAEKSTVLKLLELQRHALFMYTSCGWFFDELSGLETVQVIAYSGRVVQLAQDLFSGNLESRFLEFLERAKSNLAIHRDGRHIYEQFVKSAMLGWERVGAHLGVSSLFESYAGNIRIFCYTADLEDYQVFEAGKAKLAVGQARITSQITLESELLSFGVLFFGDHNVNGGVSRFQSAEAFRSLVQELAATFAKAEFPEIVRLIDRGFGSSTYSLRSLFRDSQRKITKQVLQPILDEADSVYRRLYEAQLPTMRFLTDLGVPLPQAFRTAAEYILNTDLRWGFGDDETNIDQIRALLNEADALGIHLDAARHAYEFKRALARMAERLGADPHDLVHVQTLNAAVDLARSLPFEVDLWQAQNVYFGLIQKTYPDYLAQAEAGDQSAKVWLEHFLILGEKLGVQIADLKKK